MRNAFIGISVGVAAGGLIAALYMRTRGRTLGVARMATTFHPDNPKWRKPEKLPRARKEPLTADVARREKLSCPLLRLEMSDKERSKLRFERPDWDKAFLDVERCRVNGVDVDDLPQHVYPFADFMLRQGRRQATARDIVKAYLLTASSIRRQPMSARNIEACGVTLPAELGPKPRPEDTMGMVLQSRAGQRYLDAAARGEHDAEAASEINRYFCKWMPRKLGEQLKYAPTLAKRAAEIDDKLHTLPPAKWAAFIEKNIDGIGVAKVGFFSALLGRGDYPTIDSKQRDFWLCPVGQWNTRTMQCKLRTFIPPKPKAKPGQTPEDVREAEQRYFRFAMTESENVQRELRDQLKQRLDAMAVSMPAKYRPNYQHLVHHAVWDKIGRAKTTHREMIDAMEKA